MNALDEIEAIRSAYLALEPLDAEGRRRAMSFLSAKLQSPREVVKPKALPRPKYHQGPYPERPIVDRVLERICEATGVSRAEILGPTRKAEVCTARFAVMAALREKRMSLPRIGKALGGRDHTTVFHGLKRADELASSREFRSLISAATEGVAA